jgi:hypothetical protein
MEVDIARVEVVFVRIRIFRWSGRFPAGFHGLRFAGSASPSF